VEVGRRIMEFLDEEAKKESERLAEQRGVLPGVGALDLGAGRERAPARPTASGSARAALRNCNVDTVAPTGTISIIAGCSSGIEPLFAVAFMRNQAGVADAGRERGLRARSRRSAGFYSEELMQRIAEQGHIHFPEVPEDVQRVFVTAHDITPEWHVRMQAAFQEYTDSAISKTTNFPHEATVEQDVREIYELAFKLGCKGVTVYRDGSRDNQVLSTGATKTPAQQAARRSWRRRRERIEQLEAELRRANERALPAEHAGQQVRRQKRKRPAGAARHHPQDELAARRRLRHHQRGRAAPPVRGVRHPRQGGLASPWPTPRRSAA
jgi:ribonucleoside-diphosphate reductase alpha chain